MRLRFYLPLLLLTFAVAAPARAQLDSLAPGAASAPAASTPADVLASTKLLFDLEKKFAADTATGGGAAFASWFAEDGVEIPNKQAPVVGRKAIAAYSTWDPKSFLLSWFPTNGLMLPAGDAGYTWGRYTTRTTGPDGKPVTTRGRYITLWRRQPDGSWKVALDTSNEAPEDCGCTVEKPSTLSLQP